MIVPSREGVFESPWSRYGGPGLNDKLLASRGELVARGGGFGPIKAAADGLSVEIGRGRDGGLVVVVVVVVVVGLARRVPPWNSSSADPGSIISLFSETSKLLIATSREMSWTIFSRRPVTSGEGSISSCWNSVRIREVSSWETVGWSASSVKALSVAEGYIID